MEKKDFNKMTRDIFRAYGFVKQKERYILFLDDITIVVKLASWRGVKSFNYYFYINEMIDQNLPFEQRSSVLVWLKAEHDLSAQGYRRHEILYENYTSEAYSILLTNMLHRIFDPFKEKGILYVKDNVDELSLNRAAEEYIKARFNL